MYKEYLNAESACLHAASCCFSCWLSLDDASIGLIGAHQSVSQFHCTWSILQDSTIRLMLVPLQSGPCWLRCEAVNKCDIKVGEVSIESIETVRQAVTAVNERGCLAACRSGVEG